MALIKCPECGGQVSDKAEACIHCGYPLKNISQNAQEKMLKQENLNIHDQKLSLKNTEVVLCQDLVQVKMRFSSS